MAGTTPASWKCWRETVWLIAPCGNDAEGGLYCRKLVGGCVGVLRVSSSEPRFGTAEADLERRRAQGWGCAGEEVLPSPSRACRRLLPAKAAEGFLGGHSRCSRTTLLSLCARPVSLSSFRHGGHGFSRARQSRDLALLAIEIRVKKVGTNGVARGGQSWMTSQTQDRARAKWASLSFSLCFGAGDGVSAAPAATPAIGSGIAASGFGLAEVGGKLSSRRKLVSVVGKNVGLVGQKADWSGEGGTPTAAAAVACRTKWMGRSGWSCPVSLFTVTMAAVLTANCAEDLDGGNLLVDGGRTCHPLRASLLFTAVRWKRGGAEQSHTCYGSCCSLSVLILHAKLRCDRGGFRDGASMARWKRWALEQSRRVSTAGLHSWLGRVDTGGRTKCSSRGSDDVEEGRDRREGDGACGLLRNEADAKASDRYEVVGTTIACVALVASKKSALAMPAPAAMAAAGQELGDEGGARGKGGDEEEEEEKEDLKPIAGYEWEGREVRSIAEGGGSGGGADDEAEKNGVKLYNYRLVIAYDGTGYGGWQRIGDYVSVQQKVEEAVSVAIRAKPDQLPIRVGGSSRTDRGVHAKGQVAHVHLPVALHNLHHFHASVNGILPEDIRLVEVGAAPWLFDARRSALSKVYHYHVVTTPIMDPMRRRYALHEYHRLDLQAIEEAAKVLVGVHDFSAFGNRSRGRDNFRPCPVRWLMRLDVIQEEDGVRFEVEGTGFMYRQVRNMVGFLLEVGKGTVPPSYGRELLTTLRRRDKAPRSAAACGLCLMAIKYPTRLLLPPVGAPETSYGRLKDGSKTRRRRRLEAVMAEKGQA